jgi:hypothetical protein
MLEPLPSPAKPYMVDASSLVDREIATLEAVLDPEVLGIHLSALADFRARRGLVYDAAFQILKWHKGKRCTLELALQTTHGPHKLIAKVYAKDRADVHLAMDGLWQGHFGPFEEFSIPEPIAYLSPLRLLLEEQVQGRVAKEIFLRGNEESRTEAAKRCAGWLAHFHRYAPLSDKISSLDQDLMRMESWSKRFNELGGSLLDNARLLFDRLAQASSRLGKAEPAAGHGSFSPDHVLLAGARTVTIDWDGYDTGDPARDVARFIVASERLALGRMGSIKALDSATGSFLHAYVAAQGPAILSRLPFYRAATCLRLVKYGVFHHRVPHWEEKVTAMLREGLRVLEA